MKIVIASDSFKGSLSSLEAGKAIESGIKRYLPTAQIRVVPISDGGEGTRDSLVDATHGSHIDVRVTGPLGKPVKASYGCLGDEKTCVIEMASASGLGLVSEHERNPLQATTFGTGELIKHALDNGFRKFILALGGSATNDAGVGMLQALGLRLLDSDGQSVGFGGGSLSNIVSIDDLQWDQRISESKFLIASDVDNPLVGPSGASHVFGPQKGATPEMVKILDLNMSQWADLVEQKKGIRLHELKGAGAAGGIASAFLAFFPSTMKRGIDIMMDYTGFREQLEGADVLFTGEGQIDSQTASGKTPMGVAQEAKKLNIPTFALAGSIGSGIDQLYQYGMTSVHSIIKGPISEQEAIKNASSLLADAAEQVIRTFNA